MASFGGIDLGGTKIEAAVFDEDGTLLGSARRTTPTAGGPQDVANEMGATLAQAARAGDTEPARLDGVGVGSPGTVEGGTVSSARNLPGWEGVLRAGPRAGTSARVPGEARQRRAGGDLGGVPARSRTPVPIAAGGLLGDRCGRRRDPRRAAVGRAGSGRRGRPRGRRDGRRQMHLRAPRLHGGLLRPGGDGRPRRAPPPRQGSPDGPLQDHAGARPHPPHQQRVGGGRSSTATSSPTT